MKINNVTLRIVINILNTLGKYLIKHEFRNHIANNHLDRVCYIYILALLLFKVVHQYFGLFLYYLMTSFLPKTKSEEELGGGCSLGS